MLLFRVYLFYTNVEANRAQVQERAACATHGGSWSRPRRWLGYFPWVEDGDGFAVMYIPELGDGWEKPSLQGQA